MIMDESCMLGSEALLQSCAPSSWEQREIYVENLDLPHPARAM